MKQQMLEAQVARLKKELERLWDVIHYVDQDHPSTVDEALKLYPQSPEGLYIEDY
jgi:hypothetical protein